MASEKCSELGGLELQPSILWRFRKLQVQQQAVGEVDPLWWLLKRSSVLSSSSCWLPVMTSLLFLTYLSIQSRLSASCWFLLCSDTFFSELLKTFSWDVDLLECSVSSVLVLILLTKLLKILYSQYHGRCDCFGEWHCLIHGRCDKFFITLNVIGKKMCLSRY